MSVELPSMSIERIREALAAGPTPGPWVTMPANAGVHCVARINAWEAVPPSDCELSHDSIDASFIAACSPANMTAILAHVEAQAAEIDRLTRERDEARAERDALANVLPGHYYMDPPDGGDVPVLEQFRRMAKDAARYRWLRTQPNDTSAPRIDVVHWTPSDESINEGEGLRLDALDAAIDAAMGLTRPAEES